MEQRGNWLFENYIVQRCVFCASTAALEDRKGEKKENFVHMHTKNHKVVLKKNVLKTYTLYFKLY